MRTLRWRCVPRICPYVSRVCPGSPGVFLPVGGTCRSVGVRSEGSACPRVFVDLPLVCGVCVSQSFFVFLLLFVLFVCCLCVDGRCVIPRVGYERQVRIRLVGVTPPRRSRVRAAASEAAANSGHIGTTGIQSGEEGQWSGTDAIPALSLPPSFAD